MAYNAIVYTASGACVGVGLSAQELFWDSLMDQGSIWQTFMNITILETVGLPSNFQNHNLIPLLPVAAQRQQNLLHLYFHDKISLALQSFCNILR